VQVLLVGLGSACGGLARWGVSLGAARWLGTTFPYGTLLINLSGCLFIGWFATLASERLISLENLALFQGTWLRPDDLKLLVAVGFTGAYTTFSTFEWEANGLFRDGESVAGTLYLVGSVALGLLAVRMGVLLARAG
jgi:CrcB protein